MAVASPQITANLRVCKKCGEQKPLSSFGATSTGNRHICKPCRSKRDTERYYRNPENPRWRMIRYRYGIDKPQYEAMLEAQGGVCAICGNANPSVRKATGERYAFHIDHDHETGEIRGLLCHRCNNGIGMLPDTKVLRAAIAYLERGE